MSVRPVAHQVVPGLLPGAAEVVERDAEGVGAHQAVGAAGQAHPVQGPVQSAGVEAQLGAERARGRQAGADTQDRVLRGDDCSFWTVETHGDVKRSIRSVLPELKRCGLQIAFCVFI